MPNSQIGRGQTTGQANGTKSARGHQIGPRGLRGWTKGYRDASISGRGHLLSGQSSGRGVAWRGAAPPRRAAPATPPASPAPAALARPPHRPRAGLGWARRLKAGAGRREA